MAEDKYTAQEHPMRDTLSQAYERMLERVRHALETAEPTLEEAIQQAVHKAVHLEEITREEAHEVADYLRRDLHDMGDYLSASRRDLRTWLRMDLQLIEARLLDLLTSVADRTRLELAELEAQARTVGLWHTGEVAGPGELTCTQCGETLHFTRSGRIPPCPRCKATTFKRARD